MWAAYNCGGRFCTIEEAYAILSRVIDGCVMTGEAPPVAVAATPFTGIIDLETGILLDTSNMNYAPSVDQVLTLVQQAAAD